MHEDIFGEDMQRKLGPRFCAFVGTMWPVITARNLRMLCRNLPRNQPHCTQGRKRLSVTLHFWDCVIWISHLRDVGHSKKSRTVRKAPRCARRTTYPSLIFITHFALNCSTFTPSQHTITPPLAACARECLRPRSTMLFNGAVE